VPPDFGAAASTKEVILGTETGQIFEMAVDEADKRDKYVKPLFELTEQKEGITGLQVLVIPNISLFLLPISWIRRDLAIGCADGNCCDRECHKVLCHGCHTDTALLFHRHRFTRSKFQFSLLSLTSCRHICVSVSTCVE
jgi:hypothetical protein